MFILIDTPRNQVIARCVLYVLVYKINNYLINQYQNSIRSFVFSVYTEVKYKKNIQLKLKNLFTKTAVVRYFLIKFENHIHLFFV